MKFEILTIFPDFFRGPLDYGIVRKAREAGLIEIGIHDLRGFTQDRHRTVDDRPFGGGEGMVLKPEPIFECLEAIEVSSREDRLRNDGSETVVLLSPQGQLFTQTVAQELVGRDRVVMICGRYEGVDERVAVGLATDEISIGDYVLAGGELPAAVVMEAVTRLLPGALGNDASSKQDSFSVQMQLEDGSAAQDGHGSRGLLDCPHFTRPVEFRGLRVPEVLLSGDHEEIGRWRRRQAIVRTWRRRPDLLKYAVLDDEDLDGLEELKPEGGIATEP
jgi:tRNA (guanine37-N1)-methyltransferase